MKREIEDDERVLCDLCGENPADQKHTYLLPRARVDPDSSAYGRDDISWCSDEESFSCPKCRAKEQTRHPPMRGYEQCSTFFYDRMPHMFKA